MNKNRLIVFIHGFTGNKYSFEEVKKCLPGNAVTIELELLGHTGKRERGADCFEAEVRRQAEFLKLKLKKITQINSVLLCGYSLGARIALGLALDFPQIFDSLILVGVNPGLNSQKEKQERQIQDERLALLLEKQGILAFLDYWENIPLFSTQKKISEKAKGGQRQQRLSHNPYALAHSLRILGLGQMPDYMPRLKELSLPTTLVTGELDKKFCKLAEKMLPHLKKGKWLQIEGVGHNTVLESPRETAEIIEKNIRRMHEYS